MPTPTPTASAQAIRQDALAQLTQIEIHLAQTVDQLSRGLNLALYQLRRLRAAEEQEAADAQG